MRCLSRVEIWLRLQMQAPSTNIIEVFIALDYCFRRCPVGPSRSTQNHCSKCLGMFFRLPSLKKKLSVEIEGRVICCCASCFIICFSTGYDATVLLSVRWSVSPQCLTKHEQLKYLKPLKCTGLCGRGML